LPKKVKRAPVMPMEVEDVPNDHFAF